MFDEEYAKQHDKSLSQVVADYFHVLTQQTEKSSISPITESLIRILDSNTVDENDYKQAKLPIYTPDELWGIISIATFGLKQN